VRELGAEHNFTRLVPDLSEGTDPDDAFSRVPYEKGFNFLYFLQSTVRAWVSSPILGLGALPTPSVPLQQLGLPHLAVAAVYPRGSWP
jgi:hypothetical protein